MTESVEELQAKEQQTQHIVDLLTQADQLLEEIKVVAAKYSSASEKNKYLLEALTDVQKMLNNTTTAHNQIMGHLKAAQEELQQQADENPL